MKTKVKTKDLVNLLDIENNGLFFKEQQYFINFKNLSEYVNYPKKHNIFEKTNDSLLNLYKNVALYIINTEDKKSYISLDLNENNPIQQGLFEFIKAIYLKEDSVFISLPEEGDNLLFIKAKKLKTDDAFEVTNLHPAKDMELGQLTSVFNQPIKNNILENTLIENKDTFSWTEDNEDLYSNVEFVLAKIKELLEQNPIYKKDTKFYTKFKILISKVDEKVIKSDDFKLALLHLNDSSFLNFIINDNNIVNIDFPTTMLDQLINQNIKEHDFTLLSFMFEKCMKNKSISLLNFNDYINKDETINYLKGKHFYSSEVKKEQFNIVSAYPFLNEKNKIDIDIVLTYISAITISNSSNNSYISDSNLYKIPLSIFNNKDILSKILPIMNIASFFNELDEAGIKNDLLSDENFLLSMVNSTPLHSIEKILIHEYHENQLSEEFFKKIITKKPALFTKIYSSRFPTNELPSIFEKFKCNFDFIYHAYNSDVSLTNIPLLNVKKEFLTIHSDRNKENFKIAWLIETQNISNFSSNYDTKEDKEKFNANYKKPEYLYLSKNNYFYEDKARSKILTKLKSSDDIYALFYNMSKLSPAYNYNFDARNFYKDLHHHHQKDIGIIKHILQYGNLLFTDLSESLQFNKELAIEFAKDNAGNIKHIPTEFFNDVEFCLNFVQLIDQNYLELNQAPAFISKFFDNQNVTKDFHIYLSSYLSMSYLSQTLDKEESKLINKRNKI